jgi:hypothetical protein
MKRRDLEHIIRAADDIADDDEIVVIGSQAILGQYPEAPPELCVSIEAESYPKNKPGRADLIDGSIGEGSPFHETYGYYAQGVGETTAILPSRTTASCARHSPLSSSTPRICSSAFRRCRSMALHTSAFAVAFCATWGGAVDGDPAGAARCPPSCSRP